MGTYHILSISEDALELNAENLTDLKAALGEAVYTLCADPKFGHLRGPTLERVAIHAVLSHGSAVRHNCELHSSEVTLLMFAAGAIHELDELSTQQLELAQSKVDEALRRKHNEALYVQANDSAEESPVEQGPSAPALANPTVR